MLISFNKALLVAPASTTEALEGELALHLCPLTGSLALWTTCKQHDSTIPYTRHRRRSCSLLVVLHLQTWRTDYHAQISKWYSESHISVSKDTKHQCRTLRNVHSSCRLWMKKVLAGNSWWAQDMLQVPWVCFWQHRHQSEWWWQVECGVVSSTLQCEQWHLQICKQWSLQQSLLVRVHSQQHKVWVTFALIITPSCQQNLHSGSTTHLQDLTVYTLAMIALQKQRRDCEKHDKSCCQCSIYFCPAVPLWCNR